MNKSSALLVDDNHDLIDLYKLRLEQKRSFDIVTASKGSRARELAAARLFDVVVIDVKLQYKGFEYGGLRLADDLRPRYGKNSVLLISQFVTQAYLQNFDATYDFLQKVPDTNGVFTTQLGEKIKSLRQQQFVFVAMPFLGRLDEIYEKYVKTGIEKAGFQVARMDHIQHTRRIHDVMFELLDKSKAVVFMADDANANAYYEAGFAEALGKEVIVIAESSDNLRFDISTKCAILYNDCPSAIKGGIVKKLTSLRLKDVLGT